MAYLTSGRNKIMGSSVSTDANIVTVIDESSTDEQVPSALATKAYVDSKDTGKDYVEITQAEYDLLTDEEKEDIVFYIKDGVTDDGIVTVIDENSTDEQIPTAKAVYDKLSDLPTGSGSKCYTTLEALGLTADATVEDVVNALKNGESFLAPVNIFTNYETMFPNKVPNDQWNKIHIIKGSSLPNSHIRCFSQSAICEYLANVNNTNVVSWNDVSGTYIDISDSTIEKLGTEILKYPVGKYRINSTTTGNKFTDLPSNAETKCGLIEINGTAVGKSPFTDTWVYRMYKFECLTGTSSYIRRLNSGATVGQIEADTGWQKDGHEIYTSLSQLGLTAPVSVGEIFNAMPEKTMTVLACEDIANHITDVPMSYGVLTIKKSDNARFSIEYQNSLQGSSCNVKRWIGTLKGLDGTGLYWKQLSAEPTFVALNDIGLTADATFQDVIDALPKGGSALLGVKDFTNYQTIFPYDEGNDQFARVHIVKGLADGSAVYARWFRKDGLKEAIAIFNINDNKFNGWKNMQASGNSTNYSKSSLSINSWSGYSSGKIYYQSVNGICYITVSGLCILSGEKTNSTQLPAGLVPATDVAQNLIDNNGKIIGRITIAEGNRTLIVKHLSANTGDNASLTFSYPIKTS